MSSKTQGKDEVKPDSIVCCDVLDGLSRIKENSVHLIICSPPYNAGIPYPNHNDRMPHLEYLSWMRSVWSECYRVLTVGGRICINIDATTNVETDVQDLVHPLHVDTTNILREIGYRYRGEIIWTKQNSPGSPTAWGSYCSCSNPRFKRNTEYVILAYKEQSLLEGDPMFCDLTKDEFHKWTLTEWRISPETGGYGHPVPFPRELVARCIKMFSYVGNTVLDPFCGSGTTPVTALEFGRHFVGIDNSEDYCRKAKSRIEEAKRHMLCCGSDDPDARTYNGYTWIPSPIHQKRARERKKSAPSRDLFV